mgnify:CR=1 FL=1
MYIEDLLERWTLQPILNASVSVDSFFVLSGFLVAFLFMKDFSRRDIKLKGLLKGVPMIYIQRYFRYQSQH